MAHRTASVEPGNSAVFVLTNDDGIDAPGLACLASAVEDRSRCRVVAPAGPWSSKSHAVTGREAIVVRRQGGGDYAVDGSPADCVRLALHHLAPGASWVVSGINRGGNLGADVYYSGTVAAAREAVLHGVPAIAFSHVIKPQLPIDWPRVGRWAGIVLGHLLALPPHAGSFWNVNFPHLASSDSEPEIVLCGLDPSPLPLRFELGEAGACYAGDYHGRTRVPGSDVDHCFRGAITVTRVQVFPAPIEPIRLGQIPPISGPEAAEGRDAASSDRPERE